jgi:hypothetical protein
LESLLRCNKFSATVFSLSLKLVDALASMEYATEKITGVATRSWLDSDIWLHGSICTCKTLLGCGNVSNLVLSSTRGIC